MDNITAGTPGYIAPEIALAEQVVDGRADLYSLGCVAYYLLTGQLVFDDANPMSMVLKHVQAAPVAPSKRTELPIPADLEQVVMACLEKSPAERPRSALQVAAMLEACRLDPWTDEQAAAMYEAGFRWILVGFESGDPRILENIQKKASRDDNSR